MKVSNPDAPRKKGKRVTVEKETSPPGTPQIGLWGAKTIEKSTKKWWTKKRWDRGLLKDSVAQQKCGFQRPIVGSVGI